MTIKRMPIGDLCSDLRVDPIEAKEAGMRPCSVSNRHLRIYVAGWMLSEGDVQTADFRRAYELYNGCGNDLLDWPGRLTDAIIAREVMQLLDWRVGA